MVKQMVNDGARAFVFNLFGNIGIRYKQFDDSTAFPLKSLGHFHFGGKIVACSLDLFKKTVESYAPIFNTKQDTSCVVILPCHGECLHTAAMTQVTTNVETEYFEHQLLTEFLQLRGALIRQLVGMGVKNFKVLDSCCATSCNHSANAATRSSELSKVTEKDGIHFLLEGYQNLTDMCLKTLLAYKKR
jgi:hypothetical protein